MTPSALSAIPQAQRLLRRGRRHHILGRTGQSPPEHDIVIGVRLDVDQQYPKFVGGLHHAVAIPAGATRRELTVTILRNGGPTLSTTKLVAKIALRQHDLKGEDGPAPIQITDGNCVPGLDDQGSPTGNTLFGTEATPSGDTSPLADPAAQVL